MHKNGHGVWGNIQRNEKAYPTAQAIKSHPFYPFVKATHLAGHCRVHGDLEATAKNMLFFLDALSEAQARKAVSERILTNGKR